MRTTNLNFEKALGEEIRRLREDRGWSQEDLANVAEVEPAQISRVERGTQSARLKTLLAISLALGKYPHELLNLGVQLPINKDFSRGKKKGPKTTVILGKLIESDFFLVQRSVADTLKQAKKTYQVELLSSAVSKILKELVDQRKFTRTQVSNSRRFFYKKRFK